MFQQEHVISFLTIVGNVTLEVLHSITLTLLVEQFTLLLIHENTLLHNLMPVIIHLEEGMQSEPIRFASWIILHIGLFISTIPDGVEGRIGTEVLLVPWWEAEQLP